MKHPKQWAKNLIPDAFSLVGISLLAYGLYQVYEPAAYIVSGMLLLVAGWRLAT